MNREHEDRTCGSFSSSNAVRSGHPMASWNPRWRSGRGTLIREPPRFRPHVPPRPDASRSITSSATGAAGCTICTGCPSIMGNVVRRHLVPADNLVASHARARAASMDDPVKRSRPEVVHCAVRATTGRETRAVAARRRAATVGRAARAGYVKPWRPSRRPAASRQSLVARARACSGSPRYCEHPLGLSSTSRATTVSNDVMQSGLCIQLEATRSDCSPTYSAISS